MIEMISKVYPRTVLGRFVAVVASISLLMDSREYYPVLGVMVIQVSGEV